MTATAKVVVYLYLLDEGDFAKALGIRVHGCNLKRVRRCAKLLTHSKPSMLESGILHQH